MRNVLVVLVPLSVALAGCDDREPPAASQPSGRAETIFTTGQDLANPFFASIGTNQRACVTCHDPEAAWSISPTALQDRFDATGGTDPVFRALDGATSPETDVSTVEARLQAYDLLLTRGLIRVGQPIPTDAEFTLSAVSDPRGFASATELSLFRRPLPASNLRFLSQIMWDAREVTLDQQATDATRGHAQATEILPEAIAQIVAFESSLYTAQRFDDVAGDLASDGARGGAQPLVATVFRPEINDSNNPGFDRQVFSLFGAWANDDRSTDQGRRRAAIAHGEQIFNTHTFRIRNVAGLANQEGTCSTCHDTPNVGSRSSTEPMDIGVSDEDRRFNGMPLYTLRNNATGRTVKTTDPGYALVTGRWDDIGKFKVPVLRGLAQRPPYFHNGIAQNLDEVVQFYIRELDVELSDGEQADLVAFLSAL